MQASSVVGVPKSTEAIEGASPMKTTRIRKTTRNLSFAAALGALIFLPLGTSAATLYWDTNGTTPGAGNPADGIWDTGTNANWTTDATGASATTTYATGSDVVFAAGNDMATATVTVSGTQKVTSITFQEGNVTITGGTIDDNGATVQYTVLDGANATVMSTNSLNANFDVQGTGTLLINAATQGSAMDKTGTGTLTVNRLDAFLTVHEGTVIYTGSVSAKLKNTIVNDTGTLRLTGKAFDGVRSLTVNTGGQFEMAAGVVDLVGSLTGGGTVTGEAGSILTVGGTSSTSTFAGAIQGSLNLVKAGTGTITLTGPNSYTGSTTINAGTLKLGAGGSLTGTSSITVAHGATFDVSAVAMTIGHGTLLVNGNLAGAVTVTGGTIGGSGTIGGALTLSGSATLSPGNSPDQFFAGDLTLGGGTNYLVEILSGAYPGNGVSGYDQTVVAGSVTLGDLNGLPNLLLDTSIFALQRNQVLTIIDNDGADAVAGTFHGLDEGAQVLVGGVPFFTISYAGGSGNDVTLTSLVPEPASGLLLTLAGLAAARRRRS